MILVNSSRILFLAIIVAVLILAFSCTNRKREEIIPIAGIDSTCLKKTSYRIDIQPILTTKCYPCHNPNDQQLGGTYPPLDNYTNSVGDTTSIKNRINLANTNPQHMPQSSSEDLSPCELTALNRWIAIGAPNN